MTEGVSPNMEVVSGLISELVKALKATAMYPPGHPARSRFVQRLDKDLLSYLEANGELSIDVHAKELLVHGQKVVLKDGMEAHLASECFGRQVRKIRFLKGLRNQDVDAFFSLISESPEIIRDEGGAAEYVRMRSSGALQVEQVDYEGILERREAVSNGSGSGYSSETLSPVAAPHLSPDSGEVYTPTVFNDDGSPELSQEEWLEGRLVDLDGATDPAEYKGILRDIFLSLRATGTMGFSQFAVRVLRHLGEHLMKGSHEEVRTTARAAVRELAKPELVESLLGDITVKDSGNRDAVQAILETVSETSIPVLLRCLADETSTFGRKALITSLSRFGSQVRPHLDRWMVDDRWYVVRNALGFLSQVGGPQDTEVAKGFLTHSNGKVRLEALRFLTRYPSPIPDDMIEVLLSDPDPEVEARAILALGALQGQDGLKRLKVLAKKPFMRQGEIAKREMAIRGLGREGSPEAMDYLRRILSGRAILDKAGFERIQVAAVEAIGEIGGARAAAVLTERRSRLSGEALRAAEDALRKLKSREDRVDE